MFMCQSCGVEAPTKYVAFYQNIGLLVVRLSKSIEGELCKKCINKYFWEFTLINCTLGWWGLLSLIMTPFLVGNNVIRYLGCLGMEAPSPDAEPPRLTGDAHDRLEKHTDELFSRINNKEPLKDVVEDIAAKAGVTPGQVVMYLRTFLRK
jgi:hypothetical protein